MSAARADRPEDAQVWVRASDREVASAAFMGGTVCSYSHHSPDQDGPNEDAMAVIPYGDHSGVLVVADGVGGTRAGAQASATTVFELCAALEQEAEAKGPLRKAILDGIENASREIAALAVGAASTVAVVELRRSTLRTYHVGDSEVLVVGGRRKIKLQTVSHSPMGYAVESGLLAEREALMHSDRHFVSNVVGAPGMRIEIGAERELAARDTVLVASDGLFDNLTSETIAQTLAQHDLAGATRALVHACRQRMVSHSSGQPHKPDDLSLLVWRRNRAS